MDANIDAYLRLALRSAGKATTHRSKICADVCAMSEQEGDVGRGRQAHLKQALHRLGVVHVAKDLRHGGDR
jgi:hypothetical protein